MSTRFESHDGVAIITIDRPEARNAIDRATTLGIAEAVERICEDRSIRVGVLTGAAGNFCAGMDLKAFLRGEVVRLPQGGFAGITQANVSKPMIAAVEGYALGGGFEIALSCDLIVAAEDAKFGLTEVRRGLVPNAGGLVRLPRQLPTKIASELVLTGDIYPASLLAQYGLINRIAPSGEALRVALEYARKIAANGPLAISVSRQVLRECEDWKSTEMFDRQRDLTARVFTSSDAKEGATAFAEKRAPVWRGE